LGGFELRPEGVSKAHSMYPQLHLGQASVEALPLSNACCDIVLLLDVLEHVDDQAALREAWRILRPQGLMIVSVPAIPWLWSFRDVDAGHRRRYTRHSFAELCATVDAALLKLAYYQFALFPLVAAARLFGRRGAGMRDLEDRRLPVLNGLFTRINQLEARLSQRVSWPWGSSLVAVLKK
jgi:SAM-dependent methyltransferase